MCTCVMVDDVTRRRTLKAAGAAGLAGVAGLSGCLGGGGGDASGTVTLGVLQPVSGDLQYYGPQGRRRPLGADAAADGDYSYEVGDVTYDLLVRDTELSADQAQTLATDLVQDEDVDMLVGCSSSGAARRIAQNVVPQAEVPFMAGPAASAGITANENTCNELVFRASENTAMDARSGGAYVANETDVESVFLFGADYSFGRAVVDNYEAVLEAEGVDIVGRRLVEQGTSEWSGLLDNAEEAGADGIVGGFTVQTLPALFTAFLQGDYSYRVFGGYATQITNSIIGGVLQNELDELTEENLADSQLGPFTTRYHWNQYDNDINDSFVETYTDAYDIVPDLFTAGTFTAASAIDQAVQSSGSTDGGDVAEALRGMTVAETPKGEDGYEFQTYNNQARSAMTVANPVPTRSEFSETWDAPVQPGEPLSRIGAGETTIPADSDQMGCSL